jgi:hypothetical protein
LGTAEPCAAFSTTHGRIYNNSSEIDGSSNGFMAKDKRGNSCQLWPENLRCPNRIRQQQQGNLNMAVHFLKSTIISKRHLTRCGVDQRAQDVSLAIWQETA